MKDWKEILNRTRLFEGLEGKAIRKFAGLFEIINYPDQKRIFNQSDLATHIYILLEGQVGIRYKPLDGEEIGIAVIEPQGVFGWSAMLGRGTYSSSALVLEDAHMLMAKGSALRDLCKKYPDAGVVVLTRLAELISRRFASTRTQLVDLMLADL